MRLRLRHALYTFAVLAWAATFALGVSQLWQFSSTPGPIAASPTNFPADVPLLRNPNLPTLVLLLHPHCPCSHATLNELAKIITACHGKVTTNILMLHPANTPDDWHHTSLFDAAQSLPDVHVITDDRAALTARFAATTSGHALLYNSEGRLLFSGGITESRGHEGDNAGRSTIVSLILNEIPQPAAPVNTPVYGCPLFDVASCKKGDISCCQ